MSMSKEAYEEVEKEVNAEVGTKNPVTILSNFQTCVAKGNVLKARAYLENKDFRQLILGENTNFKLKAELEEIFLDAFDTCFPSWKSSGNPNMLSLFLSDEELMRKYILRNENVFFNDTALEWLIVHYNNDFSNDEGSLDYLGNILLRESPGNLVRLEKLLTNQFIAGRFTKNQILRAVNGLSGKADVDEKWIFMILTRLPASNEIAASELEYSLFNCFRTNNPSQVMNSILYGSNFKKKEGSDKFLNEFLHDFLQRGTQAASAFLAYMWPDVEAPKDLEKRIPGSLKLLTSGLVEAINTNNSTIAQPLLKYLWPALKYLWPALNQKQKSTILSECITCKLPLTELITSELLDPTKTITLTPPKGETESYAIIDYVSDTAKHQGLSLKDQFFAQLYCLEYQEIDPKKLTKEFLSRFDETVVDFMAGNPVFSEQERAYILSAIAEIQARYALKISKIDIYHEHPDKDEHPEKEKEELRKELEELRKELRTKIMYLQTIFNNVCKMADIPQFRTANSDKVYLGGNDIISEIFRMDPEALDNACDIKKAVIEAETKAPDNTLDIKTAMEDAVKAETAKAKAIDKTLDQKAKEAAKEAQKAKQAGLFLFSVWKGTLVDPLVKLKPSHKDVSQAPTPEAEPDEKPKLK